MRQEKTCCKETKRVYNISFKIHNAFDTTNATIMAGDIPVRPGETKVIGVTVEEPLYIWLEGNIPLSNKIWFEIRWESSYSGAGDNFTSQITRTYDEANNTPEWKILLNSMGNRNKSANDDNPITTANVTVGDIEP